MGRVKKYNRQKESKRRRSASVAKKLGQRKQDSDSDMDVETKGQKTQGSLSIAKRRQIFKKSKEGRRDVKKRIAELRMQSKKLSKRNLD